MSYYIHTFPTTVAMKGLPGHVQAQDILSFLDGMFEVP